ncbi:MAG: hypothetical protein Q9163_005029 [Psora crenata]
MEQQGASMLFVDGDLSHLRTNEPRGSTPDSAASATPNTPLKTSPSDLRPASPPRIIQGVHEGRPSMHSTYLETLSLSPAPGEGESAFLQPPPLLQPLPERPGSPAGSKTSSRAGRPDSKDGNRAGARASSRPSNPSMLRSLTPTNEPKLLKRRTWMPGRSVQVPENGHDAAQSAQAWIITPEEKIHYDLTPLLEFKPVPELWGEGFDTLIYLHDRASGLGPSFRVDSTLFASSRKLVEAAHGNQAITYGRNHPPGGQNRNFSEGQHHSLVQPARGISENAIGAAPTAWHGAKRSHSVENLSSHGYFDDPPWKDDVHLCLPQPLQADLKVGPPRLTSDDIETLISVRNLFAFLLGRPLVASTRQPSKFEIFMHIAEILHRYDFTNFDGSTIGEEASSSFAHFVEDFCLADVRTSREQTVEAIILGERMKNWELYNEGFVHAVGKYDEIVALKSPKLQLIGEVTHKRLERGNMFLSARLRSVHARLDDFDFPSLFAGIANSTSSSESKVIRFKAWKSAFLSMRRHIMGVYKQRYGAWPPKGRSKKNKFEVSGLNRLLLQQVYQDHCDLYDVLVDRTSFTTRNVEIASEDEPDDPHESSPRALRRLLSEYDRSTPPVQPPIPFDTPLLPSLSTTRRGFDLLEPKKQKKENAKRLKDSEINTALMQSYNRDLMKSTPFLQAFFNYERKSAHGKSIDELADLRNGQWIFLYAVIQSLPLLVVDAPGLKYTDGVEYFLSEFPMESPPWMRLGRRQKTTWRVPGSDKMVDMPAASVEHSNDAIYQRSHCWQVAQQWVEPTADEGITPQSETPNEDVGWPFLPSGASSKMNSPSLDRRVSVMALALEQLPVPSGTSPSPLGSPPSSTYDPLKSFETILGVQGGQGKKKK